MEYKYKLINDDGGDNARLRNFVDSLEYLHRQNIYSVELVDGGLRLVWTGSIPQSWRDTEESHKMIELSDGVRVRISNQLEVNPVLVPSLQETLAYLAASCKGRVEQNAPNNLYEKMQLLEHAGLIQIDYVIAVQGMSRDFKQLILSSKIENFKITQLGHQFIEEKRLNP